MTLPAIPAQQRDFGLFMTSYEVIVLRQFLRDHIGSAPAFDQALIARLAARFVRCPDCSLEHEGLCSDVTSVAARG